MQKVFGTTTINGAKILEQEDQLGLVEGKLADLVVLDASSVAEAIRETATRVFVIKRGRIVAQDGKLVSKRCGSV